MALRKWLNESWIDISRSKKGGPYVKCGRSSNSSGAYPVCRPKSVFEKMTAAEIKSSIAKKRKNPKKNIKHAVTSTGKRRKR